MLKPDRICGKLYITTIMGVCSPGRYIRSSHSTIIGGIYGDVRTDYGLDARVGHRACADGGLRDGTGRFDRGQAERLGKGLFVAERFRPNRQGAQGAVGQSQGLLEGMGPGRVQGQDGLYSPEVPGSRESAEGLCLQQRHGLQGCVGIPDAHHVRRRARSC